MAPFFTRSNVKQTLAEKEKGFGAVLGRDTWYSIFTFITAGNKCRSLYYKFLKRYDCFEGRRIEIEVGNSDMEDLESRIKLISECFLKRNRTKKERHVLPFSLLNVNLMFKRLHALLWRPKQLFLGFILSQYHLKYASRKGLENEKEIEEV